VADTVALAGGFDPSRPNVARVYDYLLGGKDNFAADRAVGDQIIATLPEVQVGVRAQRAVLGRVVRYLVGEAGIRQLFDIGSGLPTADNVHDIAQRVNPEARVVYVDNDPIVLAHGQALLADNRRTRVITADLREPEVILGHPQLRALIDLSRPVAVLLVAVLHFIRDEEDPNGIIGAFRSVMAPGSHLVVSHATIEGPPPRQLAEVLKAYANSNATSPAVRRDRAGVLRLLDGFDLVEPGLVRPWQWHPDNPQTASGTQWMYAGVARRSD